MDLRALARSHTKFCIQRLAGIARASESDSASVSAIAILLDRGWGKAEQVHSGNVDQDIRITIRQLVEGTTPTTQPKVIDEKPKVISERKHDRTR